MGIVRLRVVLLSSGCGDDRRHPEADQTDSVAAVKRTVFIVRPFAPLRVRFNG
jgi:hypothetical protein